MTTPAEDDFEVVAAPEGIQSQGGTGEMIVIHGPRSPARGAADAETAHDEDAEDSPR